MSTGGKRKPPSPAMSGQAGPVRGGAEAAGGESSDEAAGADYDSVGSPGSAASGPIYVRQPGFQYHGQAVVSLPPAPGRTLPDAGSSLTCKKKKSSSGLICVREMGSLQKDTGGGVRIKTKREPLPMKLRALPQSFWQQPNQAGGVSPAAIVLPLLPPLFKQDNSPDGISEVRPVTPPSNSTMPDLVGGAHGSDSARSTRSDDLGSQPPPILGSPGSRIIRVSNTDLLFKLFDTIEDKSSKCTIVKRGRPKKSTSSSSHRTSMRGDDPCLSSVATEGLLPMLNVQQDKGSSKGQGLTAQPTLTLVSLRDGDKSVSLPALNVEQNYSQMLSELVIKL